MADTRLQVVAATSPPSGQSPPRVPGMTSGAPPSGLPLPETVRCQVGNFDTFVGVTRGSDY